MSDRKAPWPEAPPESGVDPADRRGLTSAEAAARLAADGANELPAARDRRLAATIGEALREPTLVLLVIAAAIYAALGDVHEAAVLGACVAVVLTLTIVQQHRAERALQSLRELATPHALAVRDGALRRIPGREVVRGDLVVLTEGDRVPADAVIVSGSDLAADESLLTGESAPVTKVAWDGRMQRARPGGDDLPFVYSGTMITMGRGFARVTATGTATEIGRIGKALATLRLHRTPLQRQTARIVFWLALAAGIACSALVVAYAMARGGWLDGMLVGITLAMSAMPEEFPVILAVFLALGAWRLSRAGVLVRRMPAIEALGAATVVCVDKTGTITQNRMTVRTLAAAGDVCVLGAERAILSPPLRTALEAAVLASEIDAYDPMDRAFKDAAGAALPEAFPPPDWRLIRDYPFSPARPAVAHVWQPGAGAPVVAVKGAPETVIRLCRLGHAEAAAIHERIAALAQDGQRVLGLAIGTCPAASLPEDPSGFVLRFVGLAGLHDPLRPTAAPAIAALRRAGMRVVMITGDYPGTAAAIGREAGLAAAPTVVTGADLERMDEAALARRLAGADIYARVTPDQKLRLIEAFRARGEVVAMTGDGVNDAPALRAADIGVAMGKRGTDVAREAAAIVLLDDDIGGIPRAVRLGRRTFDNIRHAMAFVLAVHVPIVGISVLPLLVGWPIILFPFHVAFLEFIIDTTCAAAFEAEPEAEDVMLRPPRDPGQPPFDRATFAVALARGLAMLAAAAGAVAVSLAAGYGEADARALSFATLALATLALIFANRAGRGTWRSLVQPNPVLWSVVALTLGALALVLFVPGLREVFRFAPLDWEQIALAALAALAAVAAAEPLRRRLGVRS